MSSLLLTQTSQATEEQNFLEKTGEFIYHGLPAAGVSAYTSFHNTGVALGNVFGGDGEKLDTENTIEDWLGEDKANYYAQNKGAVDVTGLVLGSFLPGGVAIKAARSMAAGTLATRQSKLATAIKDLTIQESRVKNWTNTIRAQDYVGLGRAQKLKLAGQNLGQQMYEAAIFETATLLTMNQNEALAQPQMGRDELGYFDAIAKNLDTALFGVAFGGVIGGGIGYLTDGAKLKNLIREVEHDIVDDIVTLKTNANAIVGDEVSVRLERVFGMQVKLDEINKLPEAERVARTADAQAIENSIATNLNDLETKLNKASTKGTTLGTKVVQALKAGNETFIEYGKPKQFPIAENMYDVLAGSVGLRTLRDEDVVHGIASRVVPDDIPNTITSLFSKELDGVILDPQAQVARVSEDFKSGKLNDLDKFLEAAGMFEASQFNSVWSSLKKRRVNFKNADGRTVPDPTGAKTKSGKVKKWSSLIDVEEDLKDFAYQFDNSYRVTRDAHALQKKAFTKIEDRLKIAKAKSAGKTGKVSKLSVRLDKSDLTPEYLEAVEELGELQTRLDLAEAPTELLSTAYRLFNQADLGDDVARTIDGFDGSFRPLYEWMANNKLLSKKYGTKFNYVDLHSGAVMNQTPSALLPDLGDVKISKKSVRAGKYEFTIKPLNPAKMTTADASAQFVHASSVKNGRLFSRKVTAGQDTEIKFNGKNIQADDLPRLQALSEEGLNGAVARLQDGESTIEITTGNELLQHIRKTKIDMIQNLNQQFKVSNLDEQQRKFYLSEVAAYADVDEAYVQAVGSGAAEPWTKGEEFFTNTVLRSFDDKGNEFFNPRTVKVLYDGKRFNEDGSKAITQSDVISRIQAEQKAVEGYTELILDKHAENFPLATTMRNGEITIANDITSIDETTNAVKSFTPDALTGGAFFQNIGASVRHVAIKETDEMQAALLAVRAAGEANPKAIAEMSVLHQSILRNNKYQFLDSTGLNTPFERKAQTFYEETLGIDLQDLMQKHLFDPLNIADPSTAILSKSAVSKIFGQFDGVTLQGTNVKTYQDQIEQLQLAMKADPENPVLVEQFSNYIKSLSDEITTSLRTSFDSAAVALTDDATGAGRQIFQIETAEVANFLRQYQKLNKEKNATPMNLLAQARGSAENYIDEDVIYPGRFRSDKFSHVAFVSYVGSKTDAWGAKGEGMVVAHSENALKQKVDHLRSKYGDNVVIKTNEQLTDQLKARNAYESELALTDTYVDQSLKKDGKLWDLAPEPNPEVFKDMIDGMVSQRQNIIRNTIALRYGQEFGALEQLDKIRNPYKATQRDKNSPSNFIRHINQALAITDKQDYKLWHSAQDIVAQAAAKARGALRGGWVQAKASGDFETFADTMERYGMPKVYENAEDFILANSSAPKDVLNGLTAKANSVFSTFMLRMDTAQAVVNAMATPIMLFPAIKGLRESVKGLDETRLARLNLALSAPIDEAGTRMPTNLKIMQQATKNLFNKQEGYWDEYVRRGIVGSDVHELKQAIEAASYTSDAGKWRKGLDKATDFISTPTDMSEKMVKYIAADSARQVLDGIGLPKDHAMYWSAIKAFTTQVVGNYNAAQRPALFQGWAGQAIGLFQTYQFNLFQQFMRHIEQGNGAAKYMMSYQAGIFGAQSVPGFQLMNQHIGERTLGEKDFYTLTEDTFDNPVSEFILYGGGSSLTRPLLNGKGIDFFNRGDLTPRTPILIPTKFDEIPAVSFLSNVLSTTSTALDNLGNGAPLGQTFLQAMSTQGVSRPIAGAFQLIQGEKLTRKGTTLLSYPEWDWATGVTKLMGSKTLNEGIVTNTFYRAQGYRTARLDDISSLGESVRVQLRSANGLQGDELNNVLKQYMEKGGNQRTFRRWMMNNYTNAHESNISRMYDNLNNNEGKYMQSVIGGRLEEFEQVQFTY